MDAGNVFRARAAPAFDEERFGAGLDGRVVGSECELDVTPLWTAHLPAGVVQTPVLGDLDG